jgi:hypothetical protein
MWEDIKEGDVNMEWIRNALINGTFVGIADGLYDREKAKTVSSSGWIIVCTTSQQTLQGLFFEISSKAGLYRGKLLGLVALHTYMTAAAWFFSLDQVTGQVCGNNIATLNQFSQNRKRVSTGVKHSNLNRAIQTLKCFLTMSLQYGHVHSPRQGEALVAVISGEAAQCDL